MGEITRAALVVWLVGCTPVRPLAATANRAALTASPILSKTQPVGTLAGQFAVGGDGSAGYTIPIEVPAGRAAMAPSLALVYSSRAGNGIAGVGWSLSGLSRIAPCGSSFRRDGEVRAVELGVKDHFCLDSDRLLQVAAEYRTEPDRQARILRNGDSDWTVYAKDGRIYHYGSTQDSRVIAIAEDAASDTTVTDRSVVVAWLLSRVEDRVGNYMTFSYRRFDSGAGIEWALARIDYTGFAPTQTGTYRSVGFEYEPRPDATIGYLHSVPIRQSQRLKTISTFALPPDPSLPVMVRQYQLAYEQSQLTHRSRLKSVAVCDGLGGCLPPQSFSYSDAAPIFTPAPQGNSNIDLGTKQLFTSDFDGDGRDDLFYRALDRNAFALRMSTGKGFAVEQKLTNPPVSGDIGDVNQVETYDENGDNRVDIIAQYMKTECCSGCNTRQPKECEHATGYAFDSTGQSFDTPGSFGYFPRFADADGDLKPDQFYTHSVGVNSGIYHITQDVWTLEDSPAYRALGRCGSDLICKALHPELARLMDLDSDGASELLLPFEYQTTPNNTGTLRFDILRKRGGTVEAYRSNLASAFEWHDSKRQFVPTDLNCTVFADVNGDGLPDAVNVRSGVTVRFNRGNWLFQDSVTAIDPASFAGVAGCTASDGDAGVRVVDYNQDGRQDLLLLGAAGDGVTQARVLESTGAGFVIRVLGIPLTTAPASARILDVDGDGLFDVLQVRNNTLELYLQSGGYADLLTQVNNGLAAQPKGPGAVVRRVDYQPLSQTGYQRPASCQYPLRCYYGPHLVVTRELTADATSTGAQPTAGQVVVPLRAHRYRDGFVDSGGDGWLGFRVHEVTDLQTGAVTRTTYSMDKKTVAGIDRYPFKGQPIEELTWVQVGSLKHAVRTSTLYDVREVNGLYFSWIRDVLVREYESATFDPDHPENSTALRTKDTTTQVDDWNNATSVQVNRGGGVLTTTSITYLPPDLDHWLMGLVDTQKVTSLEGGVSAVRTTSYGYEPDYTGRLRDVFREPSGPADEQRCTHTAARGPFGLPSRTEVTPGVQAAHGVCAPNADTRATTVGYDDEGVSVISTTNSLNQTTTFKVHRGLGVVYSVTDVNRLTSTATFDGIGRALGSQGADGSSSSIVYQACALFAMCTTTRRSDGSWSTMAVDSLGQTVRSIAPDINGQPINSDTSFDRSGRLATVWRPTRAAQPVYAAARYSYDKAGRITSVCSEVGCNTTHHQGLTTESYDENFNRRTSVESVSGTVKSTTIYPTAGAPVTTTFTYGPFDMLVTITDAAQHKVVQSFDHLGRMTGLSGNDDLGPRSWKFDALDQLREETQGDGQKVSLDYDALGRLWHRNAWDGNETFTYDTAPGRGVGGVATRTRGTVAEAFRYDELGRMAGHNWAIDGTKYQFDYSYDARGRLAKIYYPTVPGMVRLETTTTYGSFGHLIGLHGATGEELWQIAAVDDEGRVHDQRLGGIHDVIGYEPNSGRVHSITSDNGQAINEQYDYFADGDLKTRSDLRQNRSESFAYDGARRLTGATVSGQATVSFGYDAIGNLSSSSDSGCTFAHGEPRRAEDARQPGPHALTTVTCGASSLPLYYDANGNVKTNWFYYAGGHAQTSQYSSFGKPLWMETPIRGTTNTIRQEFEYDANHTRVKKRGAQSTVTYAGGLFEARQTGANTDYVFYLHAGGRVIGQIMWHWNGSSGTGERRFLHSDRLGSIIATTEGNAVRERMSYDAFGARRNPDWTRAPDAWGPTPPSDTKIAFTGHLADDESQVLDMGARQYMPALKHFLSPDTVVQAPLYGPSWNRYSYVFDNPLNYTDPTGHAAQDPYNYFFNVDLSTAMFFAGISRPQLIAMAGQADSMLRPDGILALVGMAALAGAAEGAANALWWENAFQLELHFGEVGSNSWNQGIKSVLSRRTLERLCRTSGCSGASPSSAVDPWSLEATWQLGRGRFSHDEVLRQYMAAHPDAAAAGMIFGNYKTIGGIWAALTGSKFNEIDADLYTRGKPDILHFWGDKWTIYEIKSEAEEYAGGGIASEAADLYMETLMQMSQIVQYGSMWEPGTCGTFTYEGEQFWFWSPRDGVIVYANHPQPDPVGLPELSPDSSTDAAIAAILAALAAAARLAPLAL